MNRVRRRAVIAAVVAVLTGAVVQTATAAQQAKDPVVFVHGLWGSPNNWTQMIAALKERGYTDEQLVTFGYNTTTQSNVTTATKLAAAIDDVLARTGASRVDIVGHSMGSLNSRYCVKYAGCHGKVDAWVSLAGPNNGTGVASLCAWQVTCREMVPGSAFLTKLNTGPALPEGVDGTVIWSSNDGVVRPATSSVIAGVEDIEVPEVNHFGILSSEKVVALVTTAIG